MMTARTRKEMQSYAAILMLSAWGFAIAIASFSFRYSGYHLDKLLGTSPTFMFGLFFLAVFTTIGRLYQEAWAKRKEV
jgi:hypothetical protein